MALGYMGYAKLDDIFLLCNSSGINRNVSPLISQAVWGGGWYNAAKTNFADSQQNFEGSLNFELQAFPSVWNLIADWLVEERVFSKSFSLSPNGVVEYFYTRDEADYRSGAWCSGASFTVDANSLITVGANVIALVRQEVVNYSDYTAVRTGPGRPTGPLNPTPRNLNPLPGWYAYADIDWPNAPPIWTRTNTSGFVMMNGSMNVNNNTQIIRGCTGDPNPVAVLQGQQDVDGSITLWRNGDLRDPYGDASTTSESSFSAVNAKLDLVFGGTGASIQQRIRIRHLVLTSDAFDIQAPNSPTVRTFGFTGLGDGEYPPFEMVKV